MNLEKAGQYLAAVLTGLYDEDEAISLAQYTIGFVCGLSRSQLLVRKKEELSEDQERQLTEVLARLKAGQPVQYIRGEAEFYGLKFKVDPAVLIPRPETEELVNWILEEVKDRVSRSMESNDGLPAQWNILDMGTGSGCIPVALKKNLPDVSVFAMDISENALATAAENARTNNVFVDFFKADILNAGMPDFSSRLSVIVSNPPYITLSEKAGMHRNVLEHEPALALFVPDSDPLIFYRAVSRYASRNLENKGMLFFEINERFGPETAGILAENGFINITIRKDINGKNRMIKGEWHTDQAL